MITKKQYTVGKYTLTWEFDDSEQDVSKLILNNLYIEGVWNIRETSPKDSLCSGGVQVIDDETFAFTTFGGGRFVMKIKDGAVETVSRMLVK